MQTPIPCFGVSLPFVIPNTGDTHLSQQQSQQQQQHDIIWKHKHQHTHQIHQQQNQNQQYQHISRYQSFSFKYDDYYLPSTPSPCQSTRSTSLLSLCRSSSFFSDSPCLLSQSSNHQDQSITQSAVIGTSHSISPISFVSTVANNSNNTGSRLMGFMGDIEKVGGDIESGGRRHWSQRSTGDISSSQSSSKSGFRKMNTLQTQKTQKEPILRWKSSTGIPRNTGWIKIVDDSMQVNSTWMK